MVWYGMVGILYGPCSTSSSTSTWESMDILQLYVYMVWYGMVWYGMVWYGMVWILYGPSSTSSSTSTSTPMYGMAWYGSCMDPAQLLPWLSPTSAAHPTSSPSTYISSPLSCNKAPFPLISGPNIHFLHLLLLLTLLLSSSLCLPQ